MEIKNNKKVIITGKRSVLLPGYYLEYAEYIGWSRHYFTMTPSLRQCCRASPLRCSSPFIPKSGNCSPHRFA